MIILVARKEREALQRCGMEEIREKVDSKFHVWLVSSRRQAAINKAIMKALGLNDGGGSV